MSNTLTDKKFVDIENARYDDQRQVMQEIIKAGHCPFCPENFIQYNTDPFVKEGEHWFLVPNRWPYENTKQHFLLITKAHVEAFAELSPDASAELFKLAAWAIAEYKIDGGALALRFGDTNYSAGSVQHMHAQLIQPDIDAPGYAEKPVRLKIVKVRK
jgi:ATP adenylyltransferase